MTMIFNAPADFAAEALEGFAAANSRFVQSVPGGVIRRNADQAQGPALVIGGGSGHYPAFAGLVGAGLADAAVMGNVFASPSVEQIEEVARAAERGSGVLLSFGNYAGDVLNFTAAQRRLHEADIDCRVLAVTDDVASAADESRELRRGVAGDLVVFKAAGAAIAEGHDLDTVERLARRANDRTRSFGVAFSGCTLPGATEPLFDVPDGRMALGLGIHGEPGLAEREIPDAESLAQLLVQRLDDDGFAPMQGSRLAVMLNGLGATKYEELFVLYRSVSRILAERGAVVVLPEVGELCTSFDMAGVSLTLCWLDDDLERLWRAPARSAGFARDGEYPEELASDTAAHDARTRSGERSGSRDARTGALVEVFSCIARTVHEHVDELGRLDAVAGDGDHGIGMLRGSSAARDASREAADAGLAPDEALAAIASAWSRDAGGTSGMLWGEAIRAFGSAATGDATVDARGISTATTAAVDAVMAAGSAAVGDKTMVDAMVPFAAELDRAVSTGRPLASAWASAAAVARDAAAGTADLVARRGRARPHGDKSLGTPDPGAISFALIVSALCATESSNTAGGEDLVEGKSND